MPVTLAQWTARREQRALLWPSSRVFWNDFAIFTLTCVGSFNVNLVGSLPGNEILAVILLPFLLVNHGKRAFRREYLWFYILLAGWLFGTVGGDLYLGVPTASKLKGIARVVFLGLDFVTLAILIDKKTRGMIVFFLGYAVLLFAESQRWRGERLVEWKFGLSGTVTVFSLLAASYFFGKRRYLIAVAISLLLATLNLVYALRSQIAIDLMSAVIVLPISAGVRGIRARSAFSGKEVFKLLIVLALTGGAAYGANEAVKYAANHDFFNESVESKFESQSAGKLGVLVGGRPETLVAIQAIRDSPIIGHGSFAEDPKYVQLMQDIQYEYDYTDSDEPDESLGLSIPTHSHLTQAWVESGILGGIFWIYVLVLLGRALLQIILRRPTLMPLYATFMVGSVWDLLYSPMGGTDRLVAALGILMCCDLLHAWSGKPAPSRPRSAGIASKKQFRQFQHFAHRP